MTLGGLKQNQRGGIERVLSIAGTIFSHLLHQRTQPVIQQARIINNDMPLPFVRLVDAENLRPYSGFHLIRHLAVDEIFHRPFFPIGIQHVAVDLLIRFADLEAVLRTCGKLVQLLK